MKKKKQKFSPDEEIINDKTKTDSSRFNIIGSDDTLSLSSKSEYCQSEQGIHKAKQNEHEEQREERKSEIKSHGTGCYSSNNTQEEVGKMHAVIDGCFDSQKSPFTILTGSKNHLKQAPISLADIKIPTDKMRDEMFSSESGDS